MLLEKNNELDTSVRICFLGEVPTGPQKRERVSEGFHPQSEFFVFMDRFGHVLFLIRFVFLGLEINFRNISRVICMALHGEPKKHGKQFKNVYFYLESGP